MKKKTILGAFVVAIMAMMLVGCNSKQDNQAEQVYSSVQEQMKSNYDRLFTEYYYQELGHAKDFEDVRDLEKVKDMLRVTMEPVMNYDSIRLEEKDDAITVSVEFEVAAVPYCQMLIGEKKDDNYQFHTYEIMDLSADTKVISEEVDIKGEAGGAINKDLYKDVSLDDFEQAEDVLPGDYYYKGEKGGEFYRFYDDGTYAMAEVRWLNEEESEYTGDVSEERLTYIPIEYTNDGTGKKEVHIFTMAMPGNGNLLGMGISMGPYDGDKNLGECVRLDENK